MDINNVLIIASDGIDFAEIARTFGGIIAFAIVMFIGVIFYRRESNFSDEYESLIDQYKARNLELTVQLAEMKKEYGLAIKKLEAQIKCLEDEVGILRGQLETKANK